MSGLEVTGFSIQLATTLATIIPAIDRTEVYQLWRENVTNPLSWSLLVKPDVPQVTRRIRECVLNKDAKEAWRLKESYKDTFALIAVSAAIIAQIAISMLGLPDFGTIHWSATAFAFTSLVCGLLSTFFSFYVQQILGNLHSPEDVKEWLTSPRMNSAQRLKNPIFRWLKLSRRAEHEINRSEKIPSLTAAATLTAPSRLLSLSIMSLFIALGIYLGSAYTADLGALKGSNANLAVLLFFIIASLWALFEVYLPLNSKLVDQIAVSLGHNEVGRYTLPQDPAVVGRRESTSAASGTSGGAGGLEEAFQEALRASIRAQEESLRAQRSLAGLLDPQRT